MVISLETDDLSKYFLLSLPKYRIFAKTQILVTNNVYEY